MQMESWGEDPALVYRRGYRWRRFSYRDLHQLAGRLARELEAQQVGKGDRVLLWGENGPEWIASFWACLLRGAVVVPVDPGAPAGFAERVAGEVEPRLQFCSRSLAGISTVPALFLEELGEQFQGDAGHYSPPDLQRSDLVEIVFTSGTTSDPKGVVISHGNLLAHLEPIEGEIRKYRKYERFVHPLRFLHPLPLSHLFGQFLALFVPPLLGATVILQDHPTPSEMIRTIRRERVSVLIGVPRLLRGLQEKLEQEQAAEGRLEQFRRDLETTAGEGFLHRWWRFRKIHGRFGWKFWALISGGAALDADTEEFWRRLGFVVIQGYGLTETAALVSINHPIHGGRRSIGQVLPAHEVRLDESGEILVRGEGVAAGYWQGRQLKPVEGEEGWFRTGDIGEIDEHGNLYFKGRRKEVIVTSEGKNVFPEDLERALRKQPEVRDCVVFGLPCNGNAEPCAALILTGEVPDAGAVVRRANQELAGYQHIRRWLVWPEEDFPRTPLHKPRLQPILERARQHLLQGSWEPPASGSLEELIARITGRTPPRLSPEVRLATDLDLSSIERVELLGALEERFQLDLDESRFTEATTIGDLERMVREPELRRPRYPYPRWAQRWPVTWVRFVGYWILIWPFTLLLGCPRVAGREHFQTVQGPVLMVCNHVTFLDPALVLAALPIHLRHRLAVAMLGERLEQMRHPPRDWPFWKRWANRAGYLLVTALFNVFPLPQHSGFRESFQFAGEAVDRGYSVLLFPEGERTSTGRLAPFRTGAGLLAKNLDLPVVPLRIDGLFQLKQAGRWRARPGQIQVLLGPPLRFEAGTSAAEIAQELEKRVQELSE